ncbi:alpha/beta fold hydrolase [Streptomyces sp. NPDC059002]|uniref:alpha/beta fold hydrolase n=1 Tax=Streptomyces sp. NPDC059002 TaxID=3346690 RepID=UPI0036CD17AD
MTDATDVTHGSDLSTFEFDGGSLVYRDTGEGRPLVLLHGGFLDHRMWRDQIPFLVRDHRVIAPDARGHGGSSVARAAFRHTDDLAALLRHLGTGPAILVGLSMGGATAVDTALEHPDLVSALVVSGAGTSEPDFRDPWVKGIQAELTRAFTEGDADGYVEAFTQYAPGPRRALDEVDQDVVRLLREMTANTVAKHTGAVPAELLPVADTWARAAQLTLPAFAINGGVDSADCIGMAERLVHSIPGGRAVTVDGVAHYPNMERPGTFNEILGGFLRTLPSR